jgi:hypothetical protein
MPVRLKSSEFRRPSSEAAKFNLRSGSEVLLPRGNQFSKEDEIQ